MTTTKTKARTPRRTVSNASIFERSETAWLVDLIRQTGTRVAQAESEAGMVIHIWHGRRHYRLTIERISQRRPLRRGL